MDVRKSDGSYEEFNRRKLINIVKKVFKTAEIECDSDCAREIVDSLYIYDGILCSSIRKQLEERFSERDTRLLNAYRKVKNKKEEIENFVERKINFINNYKKATNTANATVDDNSNVANKNIGVLNAEIHKEENIQISRKMVMGKVKELYPTFNPKNYVKDLENHIIYKHDESSFAGAIAPYCVSLTMYPFLTNGLKNLGGLSAEPKNIDSYCGMYCNLIFAISSQFAGACMYKDQKILINKDGITNSVKAKDFVNSFNLNKTFSNYQGDWEYLDISDLNYYVEEDEKKVKINKVYRRKYSDDIYKIKTHTNLECLVTKDHKFKVLYRGRVLEVPASELQDNETLFVGKDHSCMIDKTSKDYKDGQFLGIICGDGSITNKNYTRVTINNEQMFIKDFLDEYFENEFGKKGVFKLDKRKKANCGDYSVSSVSIRQKICDMLIPCERHDTFTKNIDITNKSIDFQMGFLDGLLVTDGCYCIDKGIHISLTNEGLIDTVLKILENININGVNKTGGKIYGNNPNRHPIFSVWVPSKVRKYLQLTLLKPCKSSINRLALRADTSCKYQGKEVYYLGPHHAETVKGSKFICVGNTHNLKYKEYHTDVLESIEIFKNDDEYVYEIETETHWYNCGGIITHNCATSEALLYFTYFCKKEWGENFYKESDSFYKIGYKLRELLNKSHYWTNNIKELSEHDFGSEELNKLRDELVYESERPLTEEELKDYYEHIKEDPSYVLKLGDGTRTIKGQIHQYWQQIVYTIGQPAAARGFQSSFVNFSYFDKPFFDGMFGNFYFPDGTQPDWESLKWIEKEFMMWFNNERLKCLLTFPVESFTLLYKDGKFEDEEMFEFVCEEYARGHSFFTYISDSVDSLSSCCRLKNKIQTKEFNFTNGNIGTQTGSKSVITLNLNRIIQDWFNGRKEKNSEFFFNGSNSDYDSLKNYINKILERVYKYHTAYNELLWEMYDSNLLPAYKAGFIDLNKQYLTIGLNGLNQAAEFLGMKCNDNEQYATFCQNIFGNIKEQNTLHKVTEGKHKLTFNTEQVPAESLAIKNYNWDKEDGYWVPSDTNLYASYVYKPNEDLTIFEKIRLMGNNYIGDYLDGGSAAHLNLDSHLSKEQYKKILTYSAENGCAYLTFNVPNCQCDDCGFIAKQPFDKCPHCGSTNISLYDRIIGYLTKIKNWSDGRQIEQKTRVYSNMIDENESI